MGATAIIVPFEDADPLIGSWRRQFTRDGAEEMPPHVTLLWPFIDDGTLVAGQIHRAWSAIGSRGPFDTAFTSLTQFAGGAIYLAPHDPQPYVEITNALVDSFLQHPPYAGQFSTVIPHMTVAENVTQAISQQIQDEVSPLLPLQLRAEEVWVMQNKDGRWVPRAKHSLGSST